jgi:hypothetical protein
LGDRSGYSLGEVYLVDFGSVQTLVARDSGTMTVVGTYGYMPPEQFGSRTVPASDLYGLGATLIYLASGQHPADLPQQDLRIDFENNVNLGAGMVMWLKQMVEPSLNQRYSSASEALKILKEPLENLVASESRRPIGSNIQIEEDADSMHFLILPPNIKEVPHDKLFPRGFFIGILDAYFLPIFIIAPTLAAHPLLGLLYLTIIFVCFIFIKLFRLLVSCCITINSQEIILFWQVPGLGKIRQAAMPIAKIDKLVYLPGGSKKRKTEDGHQVATLKFGAEIHANERIFHVGKYLTQEEVVWLLRELSQRLNLPVETKYIHIGWHKSVTTRSAHH